MLAGSSHGNAGAAPGNDELRTGGEHNSRKGLSGRPQNTGSREEAGTSRQRGLGGGRNGEGEYNSGPD